MAGPVWELASGSRVVGHARWIGGAELFAHAPWPLARQLEAWFTLRMSGRDPHEIRIDDVNRFFHEELGQRLGLRATVLRPGGAPEPAGWLESLDFDRIPAQGVFDRSGWASNRWAPEFDVDWLLRETARGEVRWTRASLAGFKAGGRCPDSAEMWVSLYHSGSSYTLTLRWRRRVWSTPIRQSAGWLFKPPLQRLHALLEAKHPD